MAAKGAGTAAEVGSPVSGARKQTANPEFATSVSGGPSPSMCSPASETAINCTANAEEPEICIICCTRRITWKRRNADDQAN